MRIDIVRCTQLAGERFLILAARQSYGAETHLSRELRTKMSQPAETEHRDQIARTSAAIPQCVERSYARTHKRRRICREPAGHARIFGMFLWMREQARGIRGAISWRNTHENWHRPRDH